MENPRIRCGLVLLALFIFTQVASALQVTPGSPCAALCLENDADPFDSAASTTNATDIVCKDDDYSSNEEGIKFKQCLECMQKSQKQNETETDVGWFIYNLRFALGTCLYGFGDEDKVISSPCVINWACQPLKDALTSGLDDEDASWNYCEAGNNALSSKNMESCVSCLASSETETYLSNFLITLQSGCEQQPKAGKLLGLSGTPFSRGVLEITDAPQNITEKEAGASSSTITTGTIVGIAVGAGLFVIGSIALVFVYLRKRRINKANMMNSLSPRDEKGSDSRSSSRTMITHSQPWGSQDQHKKSGSISSRYSGGRIGSSNSFYEQSEPNTRSKKNNGSTMPTHPAYIPPSLGGDQSNTRGNNNSNTRGETPPPRVPLPSNNAKPGAGESYMLQRYYNAPEVPSNLHNVTTMSPLVTSNDPHAVSTYVPPPPPPPPPQLSPKQKGNIPSITVPSVPRVRVPKKYIPPSIAIPAEDSAEERRRPGYKKITQPLNLSQEHGASEQRFVDRPLQGRPMQAPAAPDYGPEWNDERRFEKPMNTGRSDILYG